MADPIRPFRFYCQKVLPLVYDDSISYYETLCKVSDKLNEIITTVNNYGNNFYDYVDQQIGALDDKLTNALNNSIAQNKAYVDNAIKQNQAWVNEQILELRATIGNHFTDLYQLIQSNNSGIILYVNSELRKLRDEIPKITSVIVTSPVDGKQRPIQFVLNQMYDTLRYLGLTASEYDGLQLTAEGYDNLGLTAFEYDVYARKYLEHRLPCCSMTSPYTGEWVLISQVVNQIVEGLRMNGLTAQSYDDLSLSAQVYDNKQITAYNYDWAGVPA